MSDSTSPDRAQDAADIDPFRYVPDQPNDSTSALSYEFAGDVDQSLSQWEVTADNGHTVDMQRITAESLSEESMRRHQDKVGTGPPFIPQRIHDRLSIVGFADGHRDHAPWDTPDMEFWGINRLHAVLENKPWTRWFEIHSLEDFYRDDQQHQVWMKQAGIPIYVRPQDIPTALEWGIDSATPYPIERILAAFQPGYFNNTISWLLAMAIAMGFTEIHLYGVDMAQDHVLQAEYCLGGDTRVLTADLKWVPLSTVQIGDELVGFDEEPVGRYRRWRKTKVTGVSEVIRPSYRLVTADGTKFVASQEHRWLTKAASFQKWSETRHMQAPATNPSRQSNMVKVVEPWGSSNRRSLGYLAAAVDGEGHLSQIKRDDASGVNGYSNRIGFAQRENGMAQEFRRYSDMHGFEWGINENAASPDTVNYVLKGGRAEMIRFLGLTRPPRLLETFDADRLGQFTTLDVVKLVEKEYIGEVPLVGIETETGTFVAEGYASHNSHQRPSCEWLIGLAQGRGISVVLPPGSDLLKTSHLYGFDTDEHYDKLAARLRELSQRKEQLRGEMNEYTNRAGWFQSRISELDGAMQEIQYNLRNLVTPRSSPEG